MGTEEKNYTENNTINDLSKLFGELGKIQETQELVWYRGQRDSKHTLIPSVFRFNSINHTTYDEQVMMHEFMKRAGQIIKDVPDSKEYAKWLPIMQHYGLPTRLLDWTSSPLVALYFATLPSKSSEPDAAKNKEETDGALWCINPNKLNEGILHYGYVPPINYDSIQYLTKCAFEKDADNRCRPQIMACTCVGSYLRMFTQQANFTIHSRKLYDLTGLDGIKDFLYKIIIPSSIKEELRKQLQMMGITEDYIYPDLEHIANAVKKMDVSIKKADLQIR